MAPLQTVGEAGDPPTQKKKKHAIFRHFLHGLPGYLVDAKEYRWRQGPDKIRGFALSLAPSKHYAVLVDAERFAQRVGDFP
jgi:hypothetical protein